MNIGFDLDRVFVNYPPFIPSQVIDWLYKDHSTKRLSYRIPFSPFEQFIRKLSHFYLFRPKIKESIEFIHNFPLNPHPHNLYLISSRYHFLKDLTDKLLKRYNLLMPFVSINLNTKDHQPHLFKERVLKKLKIDLYIDDDLRLLEYLQKTCPETKLVWLDSNSCQKSPLIDTIHNLAEMNKFLK